MTQLKKQRRRGDEGPQRSSFSDGRLELSSQVLNLLKRSFHKTPVGSGLGVHLKKNVNLLCSLVLISHTPSLSGIFF